MVRVLIWLSSGGELVQCEIFLIYTLVMVNHSLLPFIEFIQIFELIIFKVSPVSWIAGKIIVTCFVSLQVFGHHIDDMFPPDANNSSMDKTPGFLKISQPAWKAEVGESLLLSVMCS